MVSNFNYFQRSVSGCEVFLLCINDNHSNIQSTLIPKAQSFDIEKYRFVLDRNKRLLARSFLYAYLNSKYKINNFELDYNKYQKPFLKCNQTVDFSISYSNDSVLVAVSDKHKIGADIEYIDKNTNHSELKAIIMHNDEIKYYNQLQTEEARVDFFFEVFSTKESLIKSIGMGLYFDVKAINILNLKASKEFASKNHSLITDLFDQIKAEYKTSISLFAYCYCTYIYL
ncbi:4'-phosphopantetheinyl transferase superfamily protein [Francisellaceae bacterium CB299]